MPKDAPKGISYYQRAADLEVARAENAFARECLWRECDEELYEMRQYALKAGEKNEADSQYLLAQFCLCGILGVPKDSSKCLDG